MSKKFFEELIKNYIRLDLAAIAVLVVFIGIKVGVLYGLLGVVVLAAVYFLHQRQSKKDELAIDNFETEIVEKNNVVTNIISENAPLLICVADGDCQTYWTNKNFGEVFEDDEDFRKKVGKIFVRQFFEADGLRDQIEIGTETYKVYASDLADQDADKRLFFFENVTARERIASLYKENRICVAFINIDNYDELIEATAVEEESLIIASVDQEIAALANEIEAVMLKIKNGSYVLVFKEGFLDGLKEKGFEILEAMHKIETKADFPTSASIGIGLGAASFEETQALAEDALDLALGRGGDQVVVKAKGTDPEFFGGALTTVEKRNKGKSRIMAHALRQLIQSSDRVFVMGHKRPDLDCFGAAVGISALSRAYGVPCDIVLEDIGDAIDLIYEAAKNYEGISFITKADALASASRDSLSVLVDAHVAAMGECPELLEGLEKIVIVDHHRRSTEAIENPTLIYQETYASSTSELVTEILQYSGDRIELMDFEANALLAGITLDTNNFSKNCGVRTFEAATWLRRNGAESTVVQDYFKMRLDFYKKKVNIIASAEVMGDGFAVAYTNDEDPAMQVLVSQVADELLEMRGVRASFVAGRGPERSYVSARSDGQVNVQTIMEALGGGGHVNIAAAQMPEGPEECIAKVVNYLRETELL